jgi:hypothetical protein
MKDNWPLADDSDHAAKCHERWLQRINRSSADKGFRDDWYAQQCLFCRYYIGVVGALAEDWGVCSHPASRFDGTVRFEHDGCECFDEVIGEPPSG